MNRLKKDILREIGNSGLPVIICGAGIVGEVLLDICRREGIAVECFCDGSTKVAGTRFHDLEVIYTPQLKSRYQEALLLISAAAIKDVVDQLESQGFTRWIAGGQLLKDLDLSQTNSDSSLDYGKFALENCILCHDGYLEPDRLFLRSIDLIITERCSLRCRDCSNLMQYYAQPRDCDTGMMMKSIDAFFSCIDEVMDFRIIGGDAFMNRDWTRIVKRLEHEAGARRIVLYTNGTIVPREQDLDVLRNGKSLVIATDYGRLSVKLGQLINALEKLQVNYHILKAEEWLDCAGIRQHLRPADLNSEIFRRCCAKNMMTMSDGKLFRCPYAANAHRLSAVPDFENDYVDLFRQLSGASGPLETKEAIRKFLLHKDYLETCDFCSGRPLSGKEVPPAVQAPHPLPYHHHPKEQTGGSNTNSRENDTSCAKNS